MNLPNKNNQGILLGIGVFFFLSTSGFAYLFKIVLRNLLLNINGISPVTIMLCTELVYLLTFVIAVFGLMKNLKNRPVNVKKLYFIFIGLLILGQILQFAVPLVMQTIQTENYLSNSSEYYNSINLNLIYSTIDAVFEYLVYVIIGIVIYKNRNLQIPSNEDSEINEIGNN